MKREDNQMNTAYLVIGERVAIVFVILLVLYLYL